MAPLATVVALEARRANEYRKRVRRAVRLVEKHRGKQPLAHVIYRVSNLCNVNTVDVRKELGL